MKIIRARTVVPMEGEPIENGAVAVDGNRIAAAGSFADVKASHGSEVLDLGEMILLPGLINAHCHLDYTILRGKIPPQHSFADWIRAINSRKAALSEADYVASIAAGLTEAQKFGTTTILNLEAFPELLPRFARPTLRAWWCAEMIDVRESVDVHEVAAALREWFHSQPDWLGGFGLAPHAPYTVSARLYSDGAEVSRALGVPITTHLAESAEEMQMFRDASGPTFEFLKGIGRPMDDCGNQTPLSWLMQKVSLDEHWIIAHLNELDASDWELLAHGPKFHVVHCPRSHTFFGHAPFAFEKLKTLGFNICLGTDSLASNSSLSLLAEVRELLRKELLMSPRDALKMVTTHPAAALGKSSSLGKISAGFYADLIAISAIASEADVFEKIAGFEGVVPWMMVNGRAVSPL